MIITILWIEMFSKEGREFLPKGKMTNVSLTYLTQFLGCSCELKMACCSEASRKMLAMRDKKTFGWKKICKLLMLPELGKLVKRDSTSKQTKKSPGQSFKFYFFLSEQIEFLITDSVLYTSCEKMILKYLSFF